MRCMQLVIADAAKAQHSTARRPTGVGSDPLSPKPCARYTLHTKWVPNATCRRP